MIDTINFKGSVKKFTRYINGVKVEEAAYDVLGRETLYIQYKGGVVDYCKETSYSDIERGIIRNYDNGTFSGMTIIFSDLEDNVIFREVYDANMELLFRKTEGLLRKVTDADGRLTELHVVTEESTYLSEKREYNDSGYCTRIVKFDDNGAMLQVATNTYDDKGMLVLWKLFADDLLPARIKKASYDDKGRLTKCICITTGKNAGKYDNPIDTGFFDHDDDLDYDDIDNSKYYDANPLTEEKLALFPEIALAIDELRYDADGNDSGIIPSLGHLDHVVEVEYDVHGNRSLLVKAEYRTDFSLDHLTTVEIEEQEYNERGLLIKESYCETKTDYDWGHDHFYEYRFDETGRVSEKVTKGKRGEVSTITTYGYDTINGGHTETAETKSGKTIRRFDGIGNRIYEASVYEDGTIETTTLEITYY